MNHETPDLSAHVESDLSAEKEPQHVYTVTIDREKLAQAKGIPEEMKEWLARLPESLHFNEPITLIVGENGSGKTTFARAIIGARGSYLKHRYPEAKNNGIYLEQEEPAFELAKTLVLSEERTSGAFRSVFIEGSEMMSEVRRWAKEEARRSADNRVEDVSGGTYTHRRSARQLFDDAIEDVRTNAIDKNRFLVPTVDIVFDEPEQGLSPQRQLALPESIASFLVDGDTMLVPTNNLALFLSDLPRLDLSQPERGVFRPSEYGESAKIQVHSVNGEV